MRIGIDLGGTKCDVVVLDAHDQVIFSERVKTEKATYEAVLSTIFSLLKIVNAAGFIDSKIGICFPGVILQRNGIVYNSNIESLNGRNFILDLECMLAVNIFYDNDANCFALSELKKGALMDCSTGLAITLGTGVGFGLVMDGKVHHGTYGAAGEWSHVPLPNYVRLMQDPRECYCGEVGCVEMYLSGIGWELTQKRCSEDGSAIGVGTKEGLSECIGRQSAETYARDLISVVTALALIIDPERIVIGGGVANIGILRTAIMKALPWNGKYKRNTPLLFSGYGMSGARGAALLLKS